MEKYGKCWATFLVHLWKRYLQKLCRIILLHLGLVTFRSGYGRDRKPFIFMISGFSDVSMTPKTHIVYLWRHFPGPTGYFHIGPQEIQVELVGFARAAWHFVVEQGNRLPITYWKVFVMLEYARLIFGTFLCWSEFRVHAYVLFKDMVWTFSFLLTSSVVFEIWSEPIAHA